MIRDVTPRLDRRFGRHRLSATEGHKPLAVILAQMIPPHTSDTFTHLHPTIFKYFLYSFALRR